MPRGNKQVTLREDLRGEFGHIFLLILSPLLLKRFRVFKLTKKPSADRMAKDFVSGVKSEKRGTICHSDNPKK